MFRCLALNRFLVASLPDWFPGTGFKQTAKDWAKTLDETASYPFRFVKEQMVCSFRRFSSRNAILIIYQASGTAEKSFVSALLEEPVTPEEENDIKWSAASLYTGMYLQMLPPGVYF